MLHLNLKKVAPTTSATTEEKSTKENTTGSSATHPITNVSQSTTSGELGRLLDRLQENTPADKWLDACNELFKLYGKTLPEILTSARHDALQDLTKSGLTPSKLEAHEKKHGRLSVDDLLFLMRKLANTWRENILPVLKARLLQRWDFASPSEKQDAQEKAETLETSVKQHIDAVKERSDNQIDRTQLLKRMDQTLKLTQQMLAWFTKNPEYTPASDAGLPQEQQQLVQMIRNIYYLPLSERANTATHLAKALGIPLLHDVNVEQVFQGVLAQHTGYTDVAAVLTCLDYVGITETWNASTNNIPAADPRLPAYIADIVVRALRNKQG